VGVRDDREDIRAAVARLDTTSWRVGEDAWNYLRPTGEAVVPILREAYPRFRKWQGRVSLVYHAIRYARTSDDAFALGLAALNDKATLVRYRACGLLAYSLREEAIPPLEALLDHSDQRTIDDARAALDAIHSCNHHFFVDRSHSGMSFWQVNAGDRTD
jgi:hypothetical protein